MESCATGNTEEICWFCRKGRHGDCMKEIPTDGKSDGPHDCDGKSDGPHDCTFDTKMIPCKCQH
jgi:hypothetical protein